jgi:hypothetical protein
MAISLNCGQPCWVDGPPMTGQSPWRQFDVGTRVLNVGTAALNQVAGGVFPSLGGMQVVASTGMNVTVQAGYCCVPNSSSSLQGGYLFGLMNAGQLQIGQSDPALPRIDLITAVVYDTGDDTAFCDVEVTAGTPQSPAVAPAVPANAIVLAQVTVNATVTSVPASAIADARSFVVAPGGILPIQNPSAAPAAPASQFMYRLDTGSLVQGTSQAGVVAAVSSLKWTPQVVYTTSQVRAASAGALTQVSSVSVTVDGATDIEIFTKWPFLLGTAAQMTLGVYIDGVIQDSVTAYPTFFQGGSSAYFTSSVQGNTPAIGTHTIAWKFQASGAGISTSDGVSGAASAPALLRVSPVAV